jgi:hypothetical protein
MIENGMGFVWAAYGITWFGLAFYSLSLLIRYKEAQRD